MAAKPNITYVRGRGLVETTRLIFAVKDVEVTEDYITTKEQFENLKSSGKLMFQQLPLLEIDGLCLVESAAQAMYLGIKYDMLGSTEQEKGTVQMLFFGARSFYEVSGPFKLFKPLEEQGKFLENSMSKARNRFLPAFEKQLTESGTGFLVGPSATIADCALFNVLPNIQEEPAYGNLLDEFPKCKAFMETFTAIPGVKKYMASPRRFPITDAAYVAEVHAALH